MRKYKGLPPLAGSEEVSASFDGADAACTCACDAAPKKPQTLEQHLKQYHGGKMPKGDCKFLKQYKKDHPDWQKDAAKATKGEAAVDTVKKDAPKGKKVSSAEFMKTEGFKKGSLVNYRMASDFSHDVWEITGLQPNGRISIKRVRDGMGRKVEKGIEIEVDATRCKRSSADAARADGKPAKADGGKEKADGGNGTKGEQKKSSAAEYIEAVKKGKTASNGKGGKKENLDDKGRYIPTQEEIDAACKAMSDSFGFSKDGVAKMVKDLIAGNRVWQGKDGGLLDIVQAMKGKGGVVRAIKERAKEQFIKDDHPWFDDGYWKGK